MSGGRAILFVVGVVLCWGVGVTCAAETPTGGDAGASQVAAGRELQLEILKAPPTLKPGEADSPEAAIRRALDARVRAEFVDVPLNVLCDEIGKKLNIPVLLDRKALSDDGVDPETPLSRSVSNARLRSVLDLTLDDLDLTWTIDNEVLLISSESCAKVLETRVYDVTDLTLVPEYGYADYDSLIELITSIISPEDWSDVGGEGSITAVEGTEIRAIALSHSFRVHEQVEELLATLRKHIPKPADDNAKADGEDISEGEKAIRRALQKKISLEFSETPLVEVVEYLKELLQVDIQVDMKSLEDEGLDTGAPISLKVSGISAVAALDLMLRDLDLTYRIEDDYLLILTQTAEREQMQLKIYDVADLLSDDSTCDDIIESITSVISPESWSEVGGWGSICAFENAGMKVLVVGQTKQINDNIAKLLADLRKIRHKENATAAKQSGQEAPDLESGGAGVPTPGMNGYRSTGERPRPAPWLELRSSRPHRQRATPVKENPDRDALVAGNNLFAFDLYAKLCEDNKDKNVFFSPHGISTAMAMTQVGARGRTAEEIAQAMHFTLPPTRLHPACRSLANSLQGGSTYELNTVNRLWVQNGFDLRDNFLKITRECYGSECGQVDFAVNREAAVRKINAWVEKQTNKRIKNMLTADVIEDDTALLLTNAVYFKGRWANPFDAATKKPGVFFTEHGEKTVSMMSMVDENCRYADIDDVGMQILEKPYDPPFDLSMLILLPKREAGSLARLEKTLSAEKLDEWQTKLHPQRVNIFLPKFRLETGYSLHENLMKLGISSAFTPWPGGADFSGISDDELYLQFVIHKAFVEVDEEGTEAAAATMGGFMGGGMMPSQPVVFRADHPFIFLIRDNRTGCIVFLGRFCMPVEPESKAFSAARQTSGGMF